MNVCKVQTASVSEEQPITKHVWAASSEVIFSNSHEHHPAPLWCLAILAPFINVITYLLT